MSDFAGGGNRQAAELLKLVSLLQASTVGLRIRDLMDAMECSRRTVERLLAELENWGLEVRTAVLDSDHHLTKRYRLRQRLPSGMFSLAQIERASLESLLHSLPSGSEKQALTKLLAAQASSGIESSIDQETLIERVAYLGRVGPKATISPHILAVLEHSIQGFERLELVYRSHGKQHTAARTVEPLGFVYSRFGYLVARQENTVKTFRFELIESAKPTGVVFDAGGFNLKAWASESFGIYHGDELRTWHVTFSKKVANRAESIQFHPSEQKKRLPDGRLQMILCCRGERELMWELSHPDWLGNVEVSSERI